MTRVAERGITTMAHTLPAVFFGQGKPDERAVVQLSIDETRPPSFSS